MKKILSFILMFIIFIVPVKADVTTCDEYLVIDSITFDVTSPWFFTQDIPFSYTGTNTLSFKFFSGTDLQLNTYNVFSILQYNSNGSFIGFPSSSTHTYYPNNNTLTYTGTFSSPFTIKLRFNGNYTSGLEGTPLLMSTNLSDIENCTLSPDTPPEPPTPDTPPASTFFSDFLSVFTDRLSFLSTSFTTEPALFCFIVIIFTFIVLELFLKLIKGGRR